MTQIKVQKRTGEKDQTSHTIMVNINYSENLGLKIYI